MDLDMYKHPTTRTSLEKLEAFGNTMIPATSGELASGLEGEGRMAEPEEIVRHLEESLLARLPWRGKIVNPIKKYYAFVRRLPTRKSRRGMRVLRRH